MANDLEELDRMIETVGRGEAEDIVSLLGTLWDRADALELKYLDHASRRLQRICGDAMLSMLGCSRGFGQPHRRVNDEVLLLLSQFMKGKRYGAILSSGAARAHKSDEEEKKLLAWVRQSFDRSVGGRLSDQLLVTPVTMEGVEVDVFKVKHENDPVLAPLLQHAYSIYVAQSLAREAGTAGSLFVDTATLRSALDDDTVLIDLCVVERDGPYALIASIWTREGSRFAIRPLPQQFYPKMWADGVAVSNSVVANAVRELRAAINIDPVEREVADTARPILERVSDLLIGLLREHLLDFMAHGKRHLCIIPHGPLHVAPFHLLQIDGRPLADDWVVTFLPNVWLLAQAMEKPRRMRKHLASIGLSYGRANPFGLALDEAMTEESDAIAKAGNGIPCLEDAATRRAFVDALEQYRFVHLAAHGKQNAIGPALHMLYLSPQGPDDGRLFAHELLGHDLRGLELVTLSACETALGRFDLGDNLSGFPAMLLMCGAGSVIGTLWDVETNAAQTFFRRFYAELRHDTRRPNLPPIPKLLVFVCETFR